MSPTRLSAAGTIIGYAFAESVRKRVFAVVIALTAAFLVLYSLGAHFAFKEVEDLGLAGHGCVCRRFVSDERRGAGRR